MKLVKKGHCEIETVNRATCLQLFKVTLCLTKHHDMKTYWGSGGIAAYSFLTSALDGGG